MAYEQKDMTGTVWVNTKRDNPKAPVLSGNVMVDGRVLRIAMWTVTDRQNGEPLKDKNGNKFYSVKLSEDTQQQQPRRAGGYPDEPRRESQGEMRYPNQSRDAPRQDDSTLRSTQSGRLPPQTTTAARRPRRSRSCRQAAMATAAAPSTSRCWCSSVASSAPRIACSSTSR